MLKKLENWYDSIVGRRTVIFVAALLAAIAHGKLYFGSRLDRHFTSAIFWSCVAIVWFFRILRERKARESAGGKKPDGGSDPE